MRAFNGPLPDRRRPGAPDRRAGARNAAVLVAPPGAGKTTRVPLALLDEPWVAGRKLILLEPRRLAARAAAERMARDAWRAGRRDGRPARAARLEDRAEDADRGGHRGRVRAHDPRRSRTRRRRGRAVRRVPRALARRRSRPRAWRSTPRRALREDLRILVMSATLDGARVAALLGDAPVIAERGPRLPGRDALSRPRSATGASRTSDRRRAARAARRAGLRAGVPARPGRDPPRRGDAGASASTTRRRHRAPLRRAWTSARRTSPSQPAAPGRRKVVLATSIAETSLTIEGVRVVIDSGLARVPRFEPAIGLTRLETVRVSARRRRPAPRPRRPHRAGRLLSAVGGSRARRARALRRAGDPARRPLRPRAGLRRLGRRPIPRPSPSSIRRPRPALAEARALLRELGAHRCRWAPDAGGQAPSGRCPCRRASPAWWSTPRRAERRSARRRDRRRHHRARARRRRRRPRASRRQLPPRPRRGAPRTCAASRGAGREAAGGPWRPSDVAEAGALLALAYPDRVAKARGGDGRVPDGERPRRRCSTRTTRSPASPFSPSPRSRAAPRRHASCSPRRIDLGRHRGRIRRPDRRQRTSCASTATPAALRARRARRLGAIALAEQTLPRPGRRARPRRRWREGVAALGIGRLPWTKALAQWRDRVHVPAPRRRRLAGPLRRSARGSRRRLARALHRGPRQPGAVTADDLDRALAALLPWDLPGGSMPRRRRISTRRPATGTPSTTRPRAARCWPSGCRSFSA